MLKLAIHGKMKAGKTTGALYLAQVYGAEVIAIADLLKANLIRAGICPERLKRKDDIHRELMQVYGQCIRAKDPDFWINAALTDCDEAEAAGCEFVVIDDLRFWNEAEHLRADGWKLIKLHRINGPDPGIAGEDPSELDLDGWDDWDLEISVEHPHEIFTELDEYLITIGA